MLLGLSTLNHHHAFAHGGDAHHGRGMDLFGFMEMASDLDVHGIRIAPGHLAAHDDEYLDALREEAAERRLFLEISIAGVATPDLERGLYVCRKLGCNLLSTRLGFDRFARSVDVTAEIDTADRMIRPLLRMFEDADVKLAIENGGELKSSELVALVESLGSTHAGIGMDVANSLLVLEDPVDAAERMIPFAISVTLRDLAVVQMPFGCRLTGTPLGEGVVPLRELFYTIREQGTVERAIIESPLDVAAGDRKGVEREVTAIQNSVAFCRTMPGIGAAEIPL